MFITHALSYGDAWRRVSSEYSLQLSDIQEALKILTPANLAAVASVRPEFPLDSLPWRMETCWIEALERLGWSRPVRNRVPVSAGRRHLSIQRLGYVKGDVSLALMRNRDILNRWLYTTGPMAARAGIVDIPIALVLTEAVQKLLYQRDIGPSVPIFQLLRDELSAMAPLSHAAPFLILAVSLQNQAIEVLDLQKEEGVSFRQIVINRSIEFPPQYHQAGLGVLTYFGNILREKYPNHDAKVRIEQDGLTVRLVIESENGDREIIEKALQEYELVLIGEKSPETLLSSAVGVLQLKNELRIAQVRIEGQRDIIALQSEQIGSLRELIGHSLTRSAPAIEVNVRPVISITNEVTQVARVETVLPAVSDEIKELVSQIADASVQARLLDLVDSLDVASDRVEPGAMRASKGLGKLREFVEDATKVGTKANLALEKIENGIGIVQSLGRKYNAVAEWCGSPQIPRALLGKRD